MDGDINKNDVRAAARKVLKPHNEPASVSPDWCINSRQAECMF